MSRGCGCVDRTETLCENRTIWGFGVAIAVIAVSLAALAIYALIIGTDVRICWGDYRLVLITAAVTGFIAFLFGHLNSKTHDRTDRHPIVPFYPPASQEPLPGFGESVTEMGSLISDTSSRNPHDTIRELRAEVARLTQELAALRGGSNTGPTSPPPVTES